MQCQYQNGTTECRGDGYTWDADHDGWDPDDHSDPCPSCNTKKYLLKAKEFAETTSQGSANHYNYTGVSLWKDSVAWAIRWNESEAKKALAEIKKVKAVMPAHNEQGYKEIEFTYDEAGANQEEELAQLRDQK